MTSYEKMQYDRAVLIYDKYILSDDIIYKNNGLAVLMTTMEGVFSIPLLASTFEEWASNHPEVAELYGRVSAARNFSVFPDAKSEEIETVKSKISSECASTVEVSISLDPAREPYVFFVNNKLDLCKRVAVWLSDQTSDDIDISFIGSIDALPDT